MSTPVTPTPLGDMRALLEELSNGGTPEGFARKHAPAEALEVASRVLSNGAEYSKEWLDEYGSLEPELLKERIARGFQVPPAIYVGCDFSTAAAAEAIDAHLASYVATLPTELELTIEALTTRGCDRTVEQQVLVDNYWSRQSELKQAALDEYTRANYGRANYGRAPRNPAAQTSSREADKRRKQKKRAQRQARKRR